MSRWRWIAWAFVVASGCAWQEFDTERGSRGADGSCDTEGANDAAVESPKAECQVDGSETEPIRRASSCLEGGVGAGLDCGASGQEGCCEVLSGKGDDHRIIKLRNKLSHLCLGVVGVDRDAPPLGTLAEVYYCQPDEFDAKQDEEWIMFPTSDGYFRLENAKNMLCLGVQGVDSCGPGAQVELYHCVPSPGDPLRDSEWKWSGDQLVNRASGLCLGVIGIDDHSAGAAVEVYGCAPTPGDQKCDERWSAY